MKRSHLAVVSIVAVGLLAAWTQNTQSEWFKGIIYAGSGKVQLTNAAGTLLTTGFGYQSSPGVIGVSGATGYPGAFAATGPNQVLTTNSGGTGLQWSMVGSSTITDASVAYADFQNVAGLSLVGRSANTTGVSAAITGTAGQVCRVSGTTLGFGTITLSDAASVTGQIPIANGGTASSTAAAAFTALSPQTTKGDLVAYSTAPIRLAVGASGSILTATPSSSSGWSWIVGLFGTATNDNACVGCVGETIRMSTAANGIALTSTTTCNVGSATCPATGGTQSITLTPGDWDVRGGCGWIPAASASITSYSCAISKTSNTTPAIGSIGSPAAGEAWDIVTQPAAVITNYFSRTLPTYRYSLAANQTIYLVSQATFTVGTLGVFGYLEARRVR